MSKKHERNSVITRGAPGLIYLAVTDENGTTTEVLFEVPQAEAFIGQLQDCVLIAKTTKRVLH